MRPYGLIHIKSKDECAAGSERGGSAADAGNKYAGADLRRDSGASAGCRRGGSGAARDGV